MAQGWPKEAPKQLQAGPVMSPLEPQDSSKIALRGAQDESKRAFQKREFLLEKQLLLSLQSFKTNHVSLQIASRCGKWPSTSRALIK